MNDNSTMKDYLEKLERDAVKELDNYKQQQDDLLAQKMKNIDESRQR